jgi:phosphoribosylformylglycinamidine synthase
MMPHPERLIETELGGVDGRPLFEGLAKTLG